MKCRPIIVFRRPRNDYGKWFCTVYLFVYMSYLGVLTGFVVSQESFHHFDRGAVDNETQQMLGGNNYGGYQVY